jgi:hypothetical protein
MKDEHDKDVGKGGLRREFVAFDAGSEVGLTHQTIHRLDKNFAEVKQLLQEKRKRDSRSDILCSFVCRQNNGLFVEVTSQHICFYSN